MDVEAFREGLASAFPARRFVEVVSVHDECDEGVALRRDLPGKSWVEVQPQFVDDNSLSLALLEPGALIAFLPAWLLRAAEKFHSRSLVLEFVIYFLCPGSDDEGWNDEDLLKMVELFDVAQREMVGRLLGSVLEAEELESYHRYAAYALKFWRPH